ANDDERALVEGEIDASGGVRKNRGSNSEATENANRKRDFLRGVAFIKMHAAAHRGNGDAVCFSDANPACVANGRRRSEAGNLFVGNAGGVRQVVGKRAETGAEDESDFRAKFRLREDEFRGAVGAGELGIACRGFRMLRGHFSMIPTMDAVMRFAIVPASMARMPRRARSDFLLGASAPMPPI